MERQGRDREGGENRPGWQGRGREDSEETGERQGRIERRDSEGDREEETGKAHGVGQSTCREDAEGRYREEADRRQGGDREAALGEAEKRQGMGTCREKKKGRGGEVTGKVAEETWGEAGVDMGSDRERHREDRGETEKAQGRCRGPTAKVEGRCREGNRRRQRRYLEETEQSHDERPQGRQRRDREVISYAS